MNKRETMTFYDPEAFGKVAVLMGGSSAEREISLVTGEAVYRALINTGIAACRFDPGMEPVLKLIDENVDRAFIALHGRGGEDGTIQGALETLRIPYTGSGVLGSALAMDKTRSKQIWMSHGIPTPDSVEVTSTEQLPELAGTLQFPLIVKPVHEGSSCGATRVDAIGELAKAVEIAMQLDPRVLVEKWVDGPEYTAAILQQRVLPLILLQTPRQFYDYEAKYHAETTEYICPCGLDEETERRCAALALQAFVTVGATGWGRVDFLIDDSGDPQILEVNTVPGMTSHSLVPMAAKAVGMEFEELVIQILSTSLKPQEMAPETAI